VYQPPAPTDPGTYYMDATLRVTSEGVFMRAAMEQRDGRMFTYDAIESVEIRAYDSARGWWYLFTVVLVLAIGFFWSAFQPIVVPDFLLVACWGVFLAGVLFLVLIAGLLIKSLYLMLFKERFDVYSVRLNGSFGYANVAVSQERAYVEQIVEAIEDARGGRPAPATPPPIPYSEPNESCYYADPDVLISKKTVTLGGIDYALADIKNVRSGVLEIDPMLDHLTLLKIIVCALFVTVTLIVEVRGIQPFASIAFYSLIIYLDAVRQSPTRRNIHVLSLQGRFGNIAAYTCMNAAYIDALRKAIVFAKAYAQPPVKRAVRRASY
jgi:hypothetical protein